MIKLNIVFVVSVGRTHTTTNTHIYIQFIHLISHVHDECASHVARKVFESRAHRTRHQFRQARIYEHLTPRYVEYTHMLRIETKHTHTTSAAAGSTACYCCYIYFMNKQSFRRGGALCVALVVCVCMLHCEQRSWIK